MITKIVFFKYRKKGFYDGLVRFLTGLPYHHVGILREDTQTYYEMGASWHRHYWSRRLEECSRNGSEPVVVDSPVEISSEYLDRDLSLSPYNDDSTYGILDYISFLPRRFGFKVKDSPGVICSEKVWDLLVESQWEKSYGRYAPSPADLFRAVTGRSQ